MREDKEGTQDQVHEDWKKGVYEYNLTKLAFRVGDDIKTATQAPVNQYLRNAVASLAEYLNILIVGSRGKGNEDIEKLILQVDNINMLLNRGIHSLSVTHNSQRISLMWIEVSAREEYSELQNKQAIPMILSGIFRRSMDLTQGAGYFIQKPFEKKTGAQAFFEAAGVSIDDSTDGISEDTEDGGDIDAL